eukprot:3198513-Pyramimonas_sp.AAC.3
MAAAGLAATSMYGAEEYWPAAKLKICITGSGGFIASHLAKRLKAEGHYIVGCDWKRNEHMATESPSIRVGGRTRVSDASDMMHR